MSEHNGAVDSARIAELEETVKSLHQECTDLSSELYDAHDEVRATRMQLREARWERRTKGGEFVAQLADPSQMRPMTWVWKPWLVGGALNLITGGEDVGKSTFQAWITARLTTGELPGAFQGAPRDVLFIGADEDSWSEIVMPRLNAAEADFRRVYQLVAETAFDVTHVAQLENVLKGGDFALVVIEQLMDVLPPMRNRHDPGAIRAALRPLTRCLRQHEVAGLGTLHTNKAAAGSFREAQQGSVQLNALSRSSFLVAKHPEDPLRRVAIGGKGNYVRDGDGTALGFSIAESVFEKNGLPFNVGRVVGVKPTDVTLDEALRGPEKERETPKQDEVEEALLEWIAVAVGPRETATATPTWSKAELAAGIGRKSTDWAFRRAADRLIERGDLYANGKRWSPADRLFDDDTEAIAVAVSPRETANRNSTAEAAR